ncbi:MAG: transglutaminase-like domain-containing protein [Alphaproteobacteria bacterium]
MIARAKIEADLNEVGRQDDAAIDLARTALLLAALDRPGVALERYRRHLDQLAAAVGRAAAGAATPEERVGALNQVLFTEHGYQGDTQTYDDLQNANLMRVIDRRKGLPVALGILYIHGARAQGWEMAGLDFPAHFLVRLESGGGRLILDPFARGAVVEAGGLRTLVKRFQGPAAELEARFHEPAGNRAVLLRLQNNIKLRALARHDPGRALRVLESMALIAPDNAPTWRELGYLRAGGGDAEGAIAALERFLELAQGADERHRAAILLQKLGRRRGA